MSHSYQQDIPYHLPSCRRCTWDTYSVCYRIWFPPVWMWIANLCDCNADCYRPYPIYPTPHGVRKDKSDNDDQIAHNGTALTSAKIEVCSCERCDVIRCQGMWNQPAAWVSIKATTISKRCMCVAGVVGVVNGVRWQRWQWCVVDKRAGGASVKQQCKRNERNRKESTIHFITMKKVKYRKKRTIARKEIKFTFIQGIPQKVPIWDLSTLVPLECLFWL